jgi:uncharacterized protein (DUF1684 family)
VRSWPAIVGNPYENLSLSSRLGASVTPKFRLQWQFDLRLGRFGFRVDEEQAELTIYAGEHGYFLPFVDALANQETYGAGRYLEPEQLSGNKFLVDFNLAYNPYCAYNERWSCPLTPFENRLKVPIRAGEKMFVNAEHE